MTVEENKKQIDYFLKSLSSPPDRTSFNTYEEAFLFEWFENRTIVIIVWFFFIKEDRPPGDTDVAILTKNKDYEVYEAYEFDYEEIEDIIILLNGKLL